MEGRKLDLTTSLVVVGGVMINVLAIGHKVRGLNPGRERWIFKGNRSPYVARLPSHPKKSRLTNVVRFYCMLKIPRDMTFANFFLDF
jgi:hypothetical protein